MQLAFIVSTIGRPDAMSSLLNSIGPHLKSGDVISVNVQGQFEQTEAVLEEAKARGLPIVIGRSQRGISIGRNTAVGRLEKQLNPGENPLLVFPNDTSVIEPSVIQFLHNLPSSFSFGGMRLDAEGSTLPAWPTPDAGLSMKNVWAVVEPGLLMRHSLFLESDGFDEALGTGAPTPWQSGEGTDLLLRVAKLHPELGFSWLPARSAWVCSPETGAGLDSIARRRKLRAYGRGYGMVLRRHDYPLLFKARCLLGAITTPIRHKERTFLDARSIFIGRLEGLIGRTNTISNQPVQAVEH